MAEETEIALMVELASEHFLQGCSKVEIAQRHGISRFQVARLLDAARDEGIVQIRVVNPLDSGQDHAELAEALGISTVSVVAQRSDESLRSALARRAAGLLQQRLQDGARLGVAWSRTLMHLPEHLRSLPEVDIVQLVGPLSAPGTSTAASTGLIHTLGSLAGGQVWPLPTPLVVDNDEVASSLRGMTEVGAALEAADELDVALVSIGGWGEGASTLWGRFSPEEQASAEEAGVQAECSGILITGDGQVARSGMEDRVIGVRPDQLRRTRVIALAPAQGHPEAVLAAARAGFVDDLILSGELAAEVAQLIS
ncbi:Cro/Cl family transcriptional regulator [Nesterenkonia sp. MY13]|uniref:Cro/Cl family transcriptional regulator n=1 Tax=Nesterenkonia sedimenti TaxID=1463632 RepID=A0A7X8TLN8_9MICC|nr:sugar-binding domain-containing protein [Nesterenkonia sedimenti]NLS10890.1 Cro/Cl family transcriptional regulator [Nesterenkonia sedimenti]